MSAATSRGTEIRGTEVWLPCCNQTEYSGTEILLDVWKCNGVMILDWPVYICDTCFAQCGCWGHLACNRELV